MSRSSPESLFSALYYHSNYMLRIIFIMLVILVWLTCTFIEIISFTMACSNLQGYAQKMAYIATQGPLKKPLRTSGGWSGRRSLVSLSRSHSWKRKER